MAKIVPVGRATIDLSDWLLEEIEDFRASTDKAMAAAKEAWEIEAAEDITTIALKAAGEVLRITFAGENGVSPPYVSLPIMWSPDSDGQWNAPPDNPLTVYLTIPSFYDDQPPTWKFTIDELLDDLFDAVRSEDVYCPEGRKILETVRDALRRQADRIDGELTPDPPVVA